MIAAVYREFGGPIRLETIALPTCPTDGVVMRVMTAGVCPSDWHGWKGHDSDIVQHSLLLSQSDTLAERLVKLVPEVAVMAAAAITNDGSTNTLQDPKVKYKILLDLFVQLWMWLAKQIFFHCWILPPQQVLIHMSNSGALL